MSASGAGAKLPPARAAASPLLAAAGRINGRQDAPPTIEIDPARAIATCLKPADGEASEGFILRLREVAERSGPLSIGVKGYRQAVRTDLLERDRRELRIVNGQVTIQLKACGFSALRLLP